MITLDQSEDTSQSDSNQSQAQLKINGKIEPDRNRDLTKIDGRWTHPSLPSSLHPVSDKMNCLLMNKFSVYDHIDNSVQLRARAQCTQL